jgi:tetratricopeptide (TPR) repeat protein
LLARIEHGLDADREEALNALYAKAQATQGESDLKYLALGLVLAGRLTEASNLYLVLVNSYPDVDSYRISLATAYTQAGQFELSKYHLRHVINHGTSEEERAFAGEQLAGLENHLGQTDQNQRYLQLQINSLRERIANEGTDATAYQRLGRLLLRREWGGSSEVGDQDAVSVLEEGHRLFPESVEILEYLTLCYLRHDPLGHLDATLLKLEKLAPHSAALQSLRNIDEQTSAEYYQENSQRAHVLLQHAQSEDVELQSAALHELERMVTRWPSNPEYRTTYAFALMVVGRFEDAIIQATKLIEHAGESHNAHFNIGQIFWICGDESQGRRHLNLALQYARNKQEQEDVVDRITELSKGKAG